jgi:hypothetical protein
VLDRFKLWLAQRICNFGYWLANSAVRVEGWD